MRLLRVTVDAFQCIEHADVELGPGLNVLYGPNDLGKSSLAAAIRNVLLLPHNSTAHEQLVSWHSGTPPRVSLTFSLEPQRIWRVTKTFGSGSAGSSHLEFSKDGISFTSDKKGREVDGALRELLRWGLSPPGGKGGTKGLPESFLTNVLLAEQSDVPAILARGLTADADESGRARLNAALQALAQDPLFKQVLDEARTHTERAFTERGQRSRAKGSPFKDVAEEIKQIQTRQDELQAKLNETAGAEGRLQQLRREHDLLVERLAQDEEALAALRQARAETEAREAAEDEVRRAREALAAVKAKLDEVDAAAHAAEDLRVRFEATEAAMSERTAAVDAASLARTAAERRLQEVTSESGAQARELAMQKLQNDRLTHEAKRGEVRARLDSAEQAERLLAEIGRAAAEIERLAADLALAAEAETACRNAAEAARHDVERQRLLEAFARRRDAQRRLEAAQHASDAATSDRTLAATTRGEADDLQRALDARAVPEPDVVGGLRALAHALEVGEAALGGGLSVVIEPLQDVRLQVSADGGTAEEHRGRDPIRLEPQRSFELRVDDRLRVSVTAGEAAKRSQVERLRARWAGEAVPILARCGVATVTALEALRAEADGRIRQVEVLRREAQGLEERAEQQEQRAGELERLRQLVAQHEQVAAGPDPTDLEGELAALGAGWEAALASARDAAETNARTAAAALESARAVVAELKATHGQQFATREAQKDAAARAAAQFADGVAAALESCRAELEQIEASCEEISRQIDAIANQAEEETEGARRDLDAATKVLEDAREALELGRTARDAARTAVDSAVAVLGVLRKNAEGVDLGPVERAVEDAESRLAALPAPASPVTPENLAAAEKRVDEAMREATQKLGEIHKAEGGLEQVGGAVVREQKEEVDRALAIALEKEHRVEVEYEAWKLLAATLRDVENSDGVHLGKALAAPLGERFRELTGNRYGNLSIGQHLDAEGIEAAGQVRPFDALSAGTRDQLATLFRLCIAEQLCTAIVLDDHLTQSDVDKLGTFRDLLRRAGQQIQVVLLTCRPGDYLLAEEVPGEGATFLDRAAGSLRAIDLGRAIRRYPLGCTGPT